jgi:hypothetical protein
MSTTTTNEVSITKSELAEIFQRATNRKVKIKEVLIESTLEPSKIIEDFLENANKHLQIKENALNIKYETLMKSLEKDNYWQIIRSLHEFLKSKSSWVLELHEGQLFAALYLNPNFEIKQAMQAGILYEYESVFCSINKISVRLSTPTVNYINVSVTSGYHPNVSGQTCQGDAFGLKIDLVNPINILNLLDSIEKMYKIPSLDSSYSTPSGTRAPITEKTKIKTWEV